MTNVLVRVPLRIVSVANMREHWATKAKRVKAHRQAARLSVGARLMPREGTLVVTLTRVAPRALDTDNLASALKATRDGVADALDVADNDPRIDWRCTQMRGAAREYAVWISITLREAA